MKKLLLSSLVLLVAATAVLAQTPAPGSYNQIVDGKRQGYWQLNALLLKMPSPWLPQQIVEEGNYEKSMKTGKWLRYFQNGNKESELTYVNNRANGPAKTYFESGQLQEEGTWVGTRWTGPYTMYYENGKVRQQFKYNALGQRDGEQLYYHPNGQLNISVNIKAGKEEGWKKEYNDKGELVEETFFNGGTMDPSKTVKHKPKEAVAIAPEDQVGGTAPVVKKGDGQEINKGETGGKPFDGNGPHTLYKNGQVTMVGVFKDWKMISGEERLYDAAGKWVRTKRYENGKYIGDGVVKEEEVKKK
jgi:antitoxin component YwqK of YwqJK toxin-antitoxin module